MIVQFKYHTCRVGGGLGWAPTLNFNFLFSYCKPNFLFGYFSYFSGNKFKWKNSKNKKKIGFGIGSNQGQTYSDESQSPTTKNPQKNRDFQLWIWIRISSRHFIWKLTSTINATTKLQWKVRMKLKRYTKWSWEKGTKD